MFNDLSKRNFPRFYFFGNSLWAFQEPFWTHLRDSLLQFFLPEFRAKSWVSFHKHMFSRKSLLFRADNMGDEKITPFYFIFSCPSQMVSQHVLKVVSPSSKSGISNLPLLSNLF